MKKIIEAIPLKNYTIQVKYSDGVEGVVDLSEFVGKGVFKIWNNYSEFENVSISNSGELKWGDDIDICPNSIYLKLTGKKPEDLFPPLKKNFGYA